MRFALQTDFALRTLIYLAGHPGRANVSDVANFFRISAHHVAKVVNQLSRLGYVRSVRGVGGGIELARRPEEIRLGDVILHFEGNLHLLECVGTENVCVIQPNCRLRGVLHEAEQLLIEHFNRVFLSDLVKPGRQLVDLLPVALSPDSPSRARSASHEAKSSQVPRKKRSRTRRTKKQSPSSR